VKVLILRSAKRVQALLSASAQNAQKDGNEHLVCSPSFETRPAGAPQDEGIVGIEIRSV